MSFWSWFKPDPAPEVAALREANAALLEALKSLTETANGSNAALKTILDGFATTAPPEVRISTDYGEFMREQAKIAGEVDAGNIPGPEYSWLITGESDAPGIYGDH